MTSAQCSGPSIREIKSELIARLPGLLRALAPGLVRRGGYWQGLNPRLSDAKKTSFTVWPNGAWKEYRDADAKGDVIDLIAYCRDTDRAGALRFARDFLGLERLPEAERQAIARRALIRAERQDAAEAARRERRRRSAFAVWLDAAPIARDDPADRYLRGRGLDLAAIAHLSGDGRFSPDLRNWRAGARAPAMIWPLRRAGSITAAHFTFLEARPDGSVGKLACEAPRLMLGDVKGAVALIAHGPSGLTPRLAAEAGRRDPLILAEGVETSLSLALAAPEARVWACLSLGNIGEAPVDHGCVGDVYVALENDVAAPALRLRAAVLARLTERLGRAPGRIEPPRGSDFNDTLMEQD